MADPIRTHAQDVPLTIFQVFEWPEVDETYRHMLLRLPGDYEARISNPDAQRLGWRLNRDAGGVLPERAAEAPERDMAEAITDAVLREIRLTGGGLGSALDRVLRTDNPARALRGRLVRAVEEKL